MKTAFYIILLILCVSLFLNGGLAAKKAGEIKDSIYTDNKYNLTFNVPPEWKASIKKAKSPVRVVLKHEDFKIPPQLEPYRDYIQTPTFTVIVDTTSLSIDTFVTRILDPEFKSKQKNYFLKHLKSISKPFEIRTHVNLKAGLHPSIEVTVLQPYTIDLPIPGTNMAQEVEAAYAGGLFFTIRGNNIFILHGIVEAQMESAYLAIWKSTIRTIKIE